MARLALALLLAAAALAALPGAATAQNGRPIILGTWVSPPGNAPALGNPPIRVEVTGNGYTARATKRDGCVANRKEAWRIDSANGGFAYGGVNYYTFGNCNSVGYGPATWTFTSLNTGRVCAQPPGGGATTCVDLVRAGSPAALPAVYGLSRAMLRCLTLRTWWLRQLACSQAYNAPGPGTVRTQTLVCNRPSLSPFCSTEIQNCVTGGNSWVGSPPACRAAKQRATRIASGTLAATRGGEVQLDVKVTGKGRRLLRKARLRSARRKRAKRLRKVNAIVVTTFTPAGGGKTVGRVKRVKIRVR